jgi:hypothetical protein
MQPSSPEAGLLSPADALAGAARHHLGDGQEDAREIARRFTRLATLPGLTAPQRRRLGQLAATAELLAADAELLLAELA